MLVGPNGAGKSTAAARARRPDTDRRGRDPPRRRRCSTIRAPACSCRRSGDRSRLMFQDALLFRHLDALDNVAFGLRAARHAQGRGQRPRGRAPRPGSGSTPKRTRSRTSSRAVRRSASRSPAALAVEPRALLLDEPLAALDAQTRVDVRRTLRDQLATFAGVRVLVTHDPLEALTLADRIVVIDGGAVVQTGTPDEVRRHPRSPYVAALLGVNLLAGQLAGDGRFALDAGGELQVAVDRNRPRDRGHRSERGVAVRRRAARQRAQLLARGRERPRPGPRPGARALRDADSRSSPTSRPPAAARARARARRRGVVRGEGHRDPGARPLNAGPDDALSNVGRMTDWESGDAFRELLDLLRDADRTFVEGDRARHRRGERRPRATATSPTRCTPRWRSTSAPTRAGRRSCRSSARRSSGAATTATPSTTSRRSLPTSSTACAASAATPCTSRCASTAAPTTGAGRPASCRTSATATSRSTPTAASRSSSRASGRPTPRNWLALADDANAMVTRDYHVDPVHGAPTIYEIEAVPNAGAAGAAERRRGRGPAALGHELPARAARDHAAPRPGGAQHDRRRVGGARRDLRLGREGRALRDGLIRPRRRRAARDRRPLARVRVLGRACSGTRSCRRSTTATSASASTASRPRTSPTARGASWSSARDPGHPNWLSTAGHRRGVVVLPLVPRRARHRRRRSRASNASVARVGRRPRRSRRPRLRDRRATLDERRREVRDLALAQLVDEVRAHAAHVRGRRGLEPRAAPRR